MFLDIVDSNKFIKLQEDDKFTYRSAIELENYYDRYLFFVDNKELKRRCDVMYKEDRLYMDSLFKKLDKNTKFKIGVIGLGFVGSAIKNSLKKTE
jgi:hypothetical protein